MSEKNDTGEGLGCLLLLIGLFALAVFDRLVGVVNHLIDAGWRP